MPIWPPVMAGKNDDNKLHQDYLSCKGTGHLAGCLPGCLGGCITIFHVCFGGYLAGCCVYATCVACMQHSTCVCNVQSYIQVQFKKFSKFNNQTSS